MKQTDRIRKILDEIDASSATSDNQAFAVNFNPLELPDRICSVIDFIQPSIITDWKIINNHEAFKDQVIQTHGRKRSFWSKEDESWVNFENQKRIRI